MAEKTLVERDLEVVWHPYTQMQTASPPVPIVRGEAEFLIDEQGNHFIDAVSSWWVNIHGHAHPHIAQKVAAQLSTLEHAIFAGFTHPPAVELAEGLLSILPQNQKRIFYSDNGSTAVEVAIKMCLQYWVNKGQPRKLVLALHDAYHGDTFGAMAVSGRSAFTAPFNPLLFDVLFIDRPDANNLDALKAIIAEHQQQLSAFIYEPLVQGSGGMLMYEPGPLDELIAFCQAQEVFCIADEVMTGFGRTGKLFASNYLQTQPDLVCLSKGLTGGTMALGVTSCTQHLYEAFLSNDRLRTFFHGHSFTANPVACAAALASLELTKSEQTVINIQRIAEKHESFAQKIGKHPKLKSIRQKGTILALEWNTGENTSYFSNLRDTLYQFFLSRGIILRPLGNIIYILPPYCISNQSLAIVYQAIEDALDQIG